MIGPTGVKNTVYQLDLFTGAPCVVWSASVDGNALAINKTSAEEKEILREVLKILENELYHSASARLVASEYIRCHLEDDYP
jgi:hypothetical protein